MDRGQSDKGNSQLLTVHFLVQPRVTPLAHPEAHQGTPQARSMTRLRASKIPFLTSSLLCTSTVLRPHKPHHFSQPSCVSQQTSSTTPFPTSTPSKSVSSISEVRQKRIDTTLVSQSQIDHNLSFRPQDPDYRKPRCCWRSGCHRLHR